MSPKTLQELQYFVGKVCSIVTTSMNRSFDERISREHFVVRVQKINLDGIWGSHPFNDELVSFFCMEHIISMHQEVELDPTNPEHATMIKEYEAKTGAKIQGDIKAKEKVVKSAELLPIIEESPAPDVDAGDAAFIDIESLEKLAENTKRTFDAQELLGKK